MTKITINQLIWDNWNLEHISKHKISKEEVEIAIVNIFAHKEGYNKRIIFLGRSKNRMLAVITAKERNNKYYIVTARDAGKKERKIIYDKEKNK